MSQKPADIVQIREVKIYNDFQKRGYTTAGAFTHFDDLKKAKIKKKLVPFEKQKRLENILNRATKKKHFQTKFGTTNIFSEIIFTENNAAHRVVITGLATSYNLFGKSKGEYAFITDLTKMIDYKIINQSDLDWLKEFIDKVQQTNLH